MEVMWNMTLRLLLNCLPTPQKSIANMLQFFKPEKIDYSKIISILEKGNKEEITALLWQPKAGKIEYLPYILSKLEELKAPVNSRLVIHQQFEKAGFELVILGLPWSKEKIPYFSIIFDKKTEKIVGFLLPFNELYHFFTAKEKSDIGDLGLAWINFTMQFHFPSN